MLLALMRSFSFCCMPVHVIHIYKLCLLLKGFSRGNKEDIFTRNHKVLTGSPKCVKQWVWCIIMVTSSSVAWKIQHKEKTPWARHYDLSWQHDSELRCQARWGRGKAFFSRSCVAALWVFTCLFLTYLLLMLCSQPWSVMDIFYEKSLR